MGLGSNYGMRGGMRPSGSGGGAGKNNGVWAANFDVHPNPNYFAGAFKTAAREAFRTFRPALLRCAEIMAFNAQLAVMSRGASVGEPWDPLDEKYKRAKTRKVGSKADGRYSETLINELTDANKGIQHLSHKEMEYGSDEGVRAIVWNFGGNKLQRSVGTYAVRNASDMGGFSRKGYTTKAYKYGRRATLWWTESLRTSVMQELHMYSMERLKAAGLPVE